MSSTLNTCGGFGGSLSCSDLLSIILQAILDLKEVQGSSTATILAYIPTICSNADSTTLAEVEATVAFGARTGSLFRVIMSVGATPTYMVNAYMMNRNYQNIVYARYPCQQGSFFKSSATQNL